MTRRPPSSSRAWLILPVLCAGIVVACVGALSLAPSPTSTSAEVIDAVHAVALRRASRPGGEDGGLIGPWWVSASGVDDAGRLVDFRLSADGRQVAARRAAVLVDTVDDSFSFELSDVVMTRLDETAAEQPLLTLDHHVLGPAHWNRDIVAGR